MKQLNGQNYVKKDRPIRILQFGEGNFLRAFVDWILQHLNDSGAINANVAVVQPVPQGRIEQLRAQDGLYTVCLEGIQQGKRVQSREIIDVLGDFVNPYTDYDKYLAYAHSEQLQTVISNTTEAGIVLDETDTDFDACPRSFPGKLLAFLWERYRHFDGDPTKGLAIVPCELIDNNGSTLRNVMVQLANLRHMDKDFIRWLTEANHFTDTLVDRIVPGYPRDTVGEIWQQTGYRDDNVVKAEVFHLWVLKREPFVEERLPAASCGLNVIFADDITPYKQRKVKILNGTHTAMVPVAYLCGLDTVGEAMNDPDVRRFAERLIFEEIKPTIDLPQEEMTSFANSVLERFQNPFIRHELMSIALNSTSKVRTRLLPTYNDYLRQNGTAPKCVMFAISALTAFMKGERNGQPILLQDEEQNLQFWRSLWQNDDLNEVASGALNYLDADLCTPSNVRTVAQNLHNICTLGMRKALQQLLQA